VELTDGVKSMSGRGAGMVKRGKGSSRKREGLEQGDNQGRRVTERKRMGRAKRGREEGTKDGTNLALCAA